MKLVAPAKINLYLWVGDRRGDGLHEVETVMQSVSLADELTIEPSDVISLDVEPAGSAPEDESNLVVKAVRAMIAAVGTTTGGRIRLVKRIPVGAGLGGGSSDAAAALVGLNDLWVCGISRKALEKLGAGIGADVPFCVRGGTAVARGAGEALAPLVVRSSLWWVIVGGPVSLATSAVYERFDALGGSGGSEPDPSEVADALARGVVERLGLVLRNDLAAAAESLEPSLGSVRASLLDAGALGAVMTGSGSAWCGLARDEDHALQIASSVSTRFDHVWVVQSLERGPRIVER
jgi:4-diphosphocytidyl-2-C-methyl-D-erythritol kinase